MVASVAIAFGSAAIAIAAPTYAPLPELPSAQVRAVTEGHGEVATSIADSILKNGSDPVAPQGVNDWNCKPSADKPTPIVLIHGMFMTANTAWAGFGPVLKEQGYCVYAVNMQKDPNGALSKVVKGATGWDFRGLADINASTELTGAFVREVMKTTGAKKVDLVGYSEGGTVANLLVHEYGSSFVRKIVTIGGINTGINPLELQNDNVIYDKDGQPAAAGKILKGISEAAAQMMTGSQISKTLTTPDTLPGIEYTNISSKYDEFVLMSTDHNPNFQKAVPGATVHNITIQDGCDKDASGHLTIPYNERVWAMMLNALAGKKVVEVPCLVAVPALHTYGGKYIK